MAQVQEMKLNYLCDVSGIISIPPNPILANIGEASTCYTESKETRTERKGRWQSSCILADRGWGVEEIRVYLRLET
jgi:hypothetical protein